jgi:hypothetical protein
MSEQLLSLYNDESTRMLDDSEPFATLPTREQSFGALEGNVNFDLLILGGGLCGVVLAHEAALQGIKVLCLEKDYFGNGALAWDTRVVRGLIERPLGLFSASSAIKDLSEGKASHLLNPLLPDGNDSSGFFAKMVKRFSTLASVDERLLIRETALAARQEGATLLSAVNALYVEAESAQSGCYIVGFRDQLTDKVYEARVGGIFLDPNAGHLPSSRLGTYVIPATDPSPAGVRVVFQAKPKSAKRGERFVTFELSDGSFVSVRRLGLFTIEASLLFGQKEISDEPSAAVLEQAANEAGWIIERELFRARLSGKSRNGFAVSQVKGIFSASTRGPWDAYRVARKIVSRLLNLLPEALPRKRSESRPLPGSERNREVDCFRALARAQGISERTIELAIRRWRGRVRYLEHFANGLKELVPGVLRGEVDLSVRSDQVVSLEDLVFGSLALEEIPELPEYLPVLRERLAGYLYDN